MTRKCFRVSNVELGTRTNAICGVTASSSVGVSRSLLVSSVRVGSNTSITLPLIWCANTAATLTVSPLSFRSQSSCLGDKAIFTVRIAGTGIPSGTKQRSLLQEGNSEQLVPVFRAKTGFSVSGARWRTSINAHYSVTNALSVGNSRSSSALTADYGANASVTWRPTFCAARTGQLWECDQCGKVYKWRGNMLTHKKFQCGKSPTIQCEFCDYRTFRRSHLRRHTFSKHLPQSLSH
ncbi:hypothetical protein J6590_014929 [Homalodisca vitripennis]|nr:hypothetical protein J6590_014929 [Homalodisca vitripennis]